MNYLTLVNKESPIKDRYFNYLELVDYYDILNENIKIEKKILEAYLQLKEFLETKNIEIGIESSYRTLEEQQKIADFLLKFDDKIILAEEKLTSLKHQKQAFMQQMFIW